MQNSPGFCLNDQLQKLVEFHRSFGVYMQHTPEADLPPDVIDLRLRLLHEELDEYENAARQQDLVRVADALTDLLYVLLGTYVAHGLQEVAVELFEEVHRSNMSKLDEQGQPVHREDGKVLKSSRFQAPNLEKILAKRHEE
jgi:predicted HAD superfamily Cof-like phosphohydrolase